MDNLFLVSYNSSSVVFVTHEAHGGAMAERLMKQIERLRRVLAKGSHLLVLTAPGDRPRTKHRRRAA